MGVANIGPFPERETDTIGLGIYMNDGKLDQVVPEHPWEGQVNIQVVYQTEFPLDSDKKASKLCKDEECPEAPEVHRHDWMAVGVFRMPAEKD